MFNDSFTKIMLFEKTWKNVADPCRPQMTTWCMCSSC